MISGMEQNVQQNIVDESRHVEEHELVMDDEVKKMLDIVPQQQEVVATKNIGHNPIQGSNSRKKKLLINNDVGKTSFKIWILNHQFVLFVRFFLCSQNYFFLSISILCSNSSNPYKCAAS